MTQCARDYSTKPRSRLLSGPRCHWTSHMSCMFIQSSEQEDECIASDKSAVPLADINYYAPSFTLLSFHDALQDILISFDQNTRIKLLFLELRSKCIIHFWVSLWYQKHIRIMIYCKAVFSFSSPHLKKKKLFATSKIPKFY